MRTWTGHVTEEWLQAWEQQELEEKEEQMFLLHIGICDYCAEQLAAYLEKDLMEPPKYLHGEILERSKDLDIQAARTVYQTSKRMRLFLYSLKVGFALAVSLLILFVSPMAEEHSTQFKKAYWEDTSFELTEKMDGVWQEFTGWIRNPQEKEEVHD